MTTNDKPNKLDPARRALISLVTGENDRAVGLLPSYWSRAGGPKAPLPMEATMTNTALDRQALQIIRMCEHEDEAEAIWLQHQWLCHPGEDCADGCDAAPLPGRIPALAAACRRRWAVSHGFAQH